MVLFRPLPSGAPSIQAILLVLLDVFLTNDLLFTTLKVEGKCVSLFRFTADLPPGRRIFLRGARRGQDRGVRQVTVEHRRRKTGPEALDEEKGAEEAGAGKYGASRLRANKRGVKEKKSYYGSR